MATIICKLSLGLKNQEVFIQSQKYSKKQTIESFQVPTEQLADFIAKTSDVSKAVLSGPIDYLKKIEEDTQKKEKSKYSKIKTEFTFL